MQEVLDAIKRHLGRSVVFEQLDYYQVIGLELYCDDSEKIRLAIQDATNHWMQSETGRYPESAQIIAKLLKQAQIILLDSEKRQRYNLQLEKLRRSQTETTKTVAEGGADGGELFPVADPMAPFAFDVTASLDFHRESRCGLLEQVQDPEMRLIELEQLFPSLSEIQAASQAEMEAIEASSVFDPRRSGTEPKSTALAQQIIRRRRRRRVLMSSLLVLSSLAILGVSAWSYSRDSSQRGTRRDRIAKKDKEQESLRIPSLPSIEKAVPSSPSTPKEKPKPQPKEITPPAMPASNAQKPSPGPSESPAGREETAEWKKLMKSAREAIDRADFDSFDRAIDQGLKIAQTALGNDQRKRLEQLKRLDQLGQLYRHGAESFAEAKKKTHGSSSSLKVGGTEVGIVESTPAKLVLKSGEKGSETFAWDKLPPNITIALLDLTLDERDPVDVASRAVYFSLAPQYRDAAKSNQKLRKKISDWFENSLGRKSANQQEIRSDLPQALNDSYE
jgi:hypothetical protein